MSKTRAKRLQPLPKNPVVCPAKYAEEKPVFSFEYLVEGRLEKPKRNQDLYRDFLIRLKHLSELGWEEIGKSQRHGYGFELIPREQFKPQMPETVTPDIRKLFVFRSDGANHAFAGFRRDDIFFVVFIESDFNELYDHG